MFEQMFADLADEALVGAIEQAAVEEGRACARRLAAIAELTRRSVDDDDDRARWAFDLWAVTAARIGAALTIGQRRASAQMRIAMALRDRLPRVAALFCEGRISIRVISELTWRTHLVDDDRVLAEIDAALAGHAVSWGALSDEKLTAAVNALIERYDPDAVRLAKNALSDRDFRIGAHEDGAETTSAWGTLMAADGVAAERRILAMINGVCENDPRSVGERRSDAAGALLNGREQLPCRCGSTDCPKADVGSPASHIVVHVIADRAAVDAVEEQAAEKPAVTRPEEIADCVAEDESECTPPPLSDTGVALLPGLKVMPAVALADAIAGGAKVAPLWLPGPDPEPHYRPSSRLAQFVRLRDMFCRFPGCDVPADRCDVDHCVPWPYGPTHPSNLNCKCRAHHLMKTFCFDLDGWTEVQLADGSVTFTDPDGRSHTTKPGSALFFPQFPVHTAELAPPPPRPPDPMRTARIPKRRRLRSADVAARVKAERAQNREVRAALANPRYGPEGHPPF
ncbi:HNH endonuclease signature motif containing protein [Mycobacterium sp. PSTR-4-N]|uniref:HNH endonuclease signature motif containing protein n=1 Tax=Mycobacterium sp. PSTR-4-N TaxID=2917745 RepID=UPI001F1502C4|nr:HNH endonuclease signature motif containing protein [Mycobacterium sp. PSTR-4-N]MCG7595084.1 HNH endonuclease [Mycobacterium sp. PSTR-4-N]